MLPRILVGSLVTLGLLAGCKPSPERGLIGTWKIQGRPETNGVWTYRADHTLEFKGDDELGPVSANGAWRVQGDKVTFSLAASARHAGVPDTTITIVSLTATQLQLRTVGETVVTFNRMK
jgi:hypothetical protein